MQSMDIHEQIKSAYKGVKNYPDLAQKLVNIGILSYTVDAATTTILYRLENGENVLHAGSNNPRDIAQYFDKEKTVAAIRENQQGKSDFPGFMNAIANAGVRFYEATLNGEKKRVTYIGSGGHYEEVIPI